MRSNTRRCGSALSNAWRGGRGHYLRTLPTQVASMSGWHTSILSLTKWSRGILMRCPSSLSSSGIIDHSPGLWDANQKVAEVSACTMYTVLFRQLRLFNHCHQITIVFILVRLMTDRVERVAEIVWIVWQHKRGSSASSNNTLLLLCFWKYTFELTF